MEQNTEMNLRLNEIEKRQLDNECKYHEMDKRMIQIQGDMTHIKGRIDDGISSTITKIWDEVNRFTNEVKPKVDESKEWVDKFKSAIYYIAIIGTVSTAIAIATALLKIFWK